MIKIDNLTIETLKGRRLVENLSFVLNDGCKLAIIGEEGNGKSTILKAIYNKDLISDYCKVTGKVYTENGNIGYLEQKLSNVWLNSSVSEFLTKTSPQEESDYSIFENYSKTEKYEKLLNIKQIIVADAQLKTLSGGELVKLQLFKILLKQPDLLLLDEPTNDLDIQTLTWLEKFINNFTKPIIFVSHDKQLLQNCANQILHIEQLVKKQQPKHTLAKMGYEQYVETRQLSIKKQTQQAYCEMRKHKKQEEILRNIKQKVENALNKAIRDPSTGRILAKKMANVKAQESKLENEEHTEVPDVEEAITLILNEDVSVPKHKEVLNFFVKELKIGENLLSRNVCLQIKGNKKIAIIGNNGAGKSTLIKRILPYLDTVAGLKVGYFSQNYFESLNYNQSAVEELENIKTNKNIQTVLGSLKLTKEEMKKPIKDLSEGQKAKILMLKLILTNCNVLVLDEPTRNLSPLSSPVIWKLLNGFNGVIIAVSHDRAFIKELFDEVYLLDKLGLHKIDKDKI